MNIKVKRFTKTFSQNCPLHYDTGWEMALQEKALGSIWQPESDLQRSHGGRRDQLQQAVLWPLTHCGTCTFIYRKTNFFRLLSVKQNFIQTMKRKLNHFNVIWGLDIMQINVFTLLRENLELLKLPMFILVKSPENWSDALWHSAMFIYCIFLCLSLLSFKIRAVLSVFCGLNSSTNWSKTST